VLSSKRSAADALFWFQIITTLLLTGSQFVRMLETVEGVNIARFLTTEIFVGINLYLALKAHRSEPSRVTRQVITVYVLWVVLIAFDIAAILWNGSYAWSVNDTATMISTFALSIIILSVGVVLKRGYRDPIIQGLMAVPFKAIPQVLVSVTILQEGNAGIPGLAIIVGFVTIAVRIGQLSYSIKEAGWDRNRKGSLLSEAFNGVAGVIVTVAWCIKQEP